MGLPARTADATRLPRPGLDLHEVLGGRWQLLWWAATTTPSQVTCRVLVELQHVEHHVPKVKTLEGIFGTILSNRRQKLQ